MLSMRGCADDEVGADGAGAGKREGSYAREDGADGVRTFGNLGWIAATLDFAEGDAFDPAHEDVRRGVGVAGAVGIEDLRDGDGGGDEAVEVEFLAAGGGVARVEAEDEGVGEASDVDAIDGVAESAGEGFAGEDGAAGQRAREDAREHGSHLHMAPELRVGRA